VACPRSSLGCREDVVTGGGGGEGCGSYSGEEEGGVRVSGRGLGGKKGEEIRWGDKLGGKGERGFSDLES